MRTRPQTETPAPGVPVQDSPRDGGPIVVALAGAPNVGKSSIFNPLTGLSQHVGNWPGKTVEQKTGTYRRNGRTFEIIDLPGTYSLSANSAEEQIARDYVIQATPDVVAVIVNAANLERTLYLVAEFLELPSRLVVGVNMMDVAESNGIRIETRVLQAALGIPVVPMSATHGTGIQELVDAIETVVDGKFPEQASRPVFDADTEALIAEIEECLGEAPLAPYPRRWLAVKLLEGDREIAKTLAGRLEPERWQRAQEILHRHEDSVLAIAGARYEWVGRMVRAAVRRPRAGVISLTERLDRVATHPLWGSLLLVGMLGLIFWLVYQVSTPVVDLLGSGLTLLGNLIRSWLTWAPSWVGGMLVDGLLGGAGTVLTLLPILALFFVAIAILEDVGYLARGAFVADRFMHRLGLHGKSFLPLFLGMGCNVPAALGTRILDSPRERLLTLQLVPLVPCAGRMAVLVFVAGALFGSGAPLVIAGLLALSIGVVVLTGRALDRVLPRSDTAAFIMELPLYHVPNWKTIGIYAWNRVKEFVVRAGTVVLGVSVLVWILSVVPGGDMDDSVLAWIGRALAPVGHLMGLDWKGMVALLASVVAKEQSIATLAVLTSGSEATLAVSLPRLMAPAAGVAFLVVQMLFVPCVATMAAIRQEARSWRWMAFSIAYLAVTSFTIGILVYQSAKLLGWGV